MLGSHCIVCSRERRDNEYKCPACGCASYADTIPGAALAAPVEAWPLRGVLADTLVLAAGDVALLFGPRGIGKSSLALGLFELPHVVSSEMSLTRVRAYAVRLRIALASLSRPVRDDETGAIDLGIDPMMPPRPVVVDSLQGIGGDPVVALREIRAYCRAFSVPAVVTSQVTAEGRARGSETIPHDCDAVVELAATALGRVAHVLKSRNSAEASISYAIGLDGVVAPQWGKLYYSVEGRFPSFELRPYPSAHGAPRHAALLDAARGGSPVTGFPPPPCAVSALDAGGLYPGRAYIEPADGDERRAFALRHGLRYFDASGKVHDPSGVYE
jgi:hypothetical protein